MSLRGWWGKLSKEAFWQRQLSAEARMDSIVDVVEDLMAENKKLKEKVVIHKKCEICDEYGHAGDMAVMAVGHCVDLGMKETIPQMAYILSSVQELYLYFHPACLKKAGYRKVEDNVAGWVKKRAK